MTPALLTRQSSCPNIPGLGKLTRPRDDSLRNVGNLFEPALVTTGRHHVPAILSEGDCYGGTYAGTCTSDKCDAHDDFPDSVNVISSVYHGIEEAWLQAWKTAMTCIDMNADLGEGDSNERCYR
jgi:hypothetical protein